MQGFHGLFLCAKTALRVAQLRPGWQAFFVREPHFFLNFFPFLAQFSCRHFLFNKTLNKASHRDLWHRVPG